MEDNKSKGLVVVIIILALLLILVSGYVVYDKLQNTGSNGSDNKIVNKSEDITSSEELNIKSDFLKDLVERVNSVTTCEGLDTELKQDFMKVSDFTNTKRLEMAARITELYDGKDVGEDYPNIAYESDLIESFRKIFGNNATYKAEDFDNACPNLKYDAKNKIYYQEGGCGDACLPAPKEEAISAKKYSDKIEINVAEAFIGEGGVYSDSGMKNKISSNDEISLVEVKDKLKQYKYTFTYDNETGNYYFYSIERINK